MPVSEPAATGHQPLATSPCCAPRGATGPVRRSRNAYYARL